MNTDTSNCVKNLLASKTTRQLYYKERATGFGVYIILILHPAKTAAVPIMSTTSPSLPSWSRNAPTTSIISSPNSDYSTSSAPDTPLSCSCKGEYTEEAEPAEEDANDCEQYDWIEELSLQDDGENTVMRSEDSHRPKYIPPRRSRDFLLTTTSSMSLR